MATQTVSHYPIGGLPVRNPFALPVEELDADCIFQCRISWLPCKWSRSDFRCSLPSPAKISCLTNHPLCLEDAAVTDTACGRCPPHVLTRCLVTSHHVTRWWLMKTNLRHTSQPFVTIILHFKWRVFWTDTHWIRVKRLFPLLSVLGSVTQNNIYN